MSEKNNVPESENASSESVLYKVKLGIAYITLNTKMNTINMDTARKLVQLLNESDKNPKVKVVVLNSVGDRIFSAGFDLDIGCVGQCL